MAADKPTVEKTDICFCLFSCFVQNTPVFIAFLVRKSLF